MPATELFFRRTESEAYIYEPTLEKHMYAKKSSTYWRPVRSPPTMFITAILNTKLENIVNKPAIPEKKNH